MEPDYADWVCFQRSASTRRRAAKAMLVLLVVAQMAFVMRVAVKVPQASKDSVSCCVVGRSVK